MKHFGSKRVIMAIFQHGLKDFAHWDIFFVAFFKTDQLKQM